MFEKKGKPSPRRQQELDAYQQMVAQTSPPSAILQGLFRAFWVGGVICVVGQALADWGKTGLHMTVQQAGGFASVCLILLTAVLTGLGVFDKLGKYAGAGTFVPISGFANSMVSAAMEFRREGLVMGVGVRLFSVAGPVLLYGISASALVGILYALFPWR